MPSLSLPNLAAPRCGTCKHYTGNEAQGECRRYPPTAEMLGDPSKGPATRVSHFPVVNGKEHYCGEYTYRIAIAQ